MEERATETVIDTHCCQQSLNKSLFLHFLFNDHDNQIYTWLMKYSFSNLPDQSKVITGVWKEECGRNQVFVHMGSCLASFTAFNGSGVYVAYQLSNSLQEIYCDVERERF